MKLKLKTFVSGITMLFVMYSGSLFAEDSVQPKNAGGSVLIEYIDVTLMRRSLDSAPVIGSGAEDYSVKIGCMGKADCIAKIRSIYDLISIKKNTVASCKAPIYARVTITPDLVSYGESEKNESEVYDIDYTGKCVNYGGSSYEIKKSVFEILNTKPISSWSKGKK